MRVNKTESSRYSPEISFRRAQACPRGAGASGDLWRGGVRPWGCARGMVRRRLVRRVNMISVKQADRPDFVTATTLAGIRYDSHSSRRRITPALKLPTRTLREPPQRVPIWDCSRWRLPRFTVTEYARLCGPIPRLVLPGLRRSAFGGRPLTVTLLYGVRTFLPPTHYAPASDCLACFTAPLYRASARRTKFPSPVLAVIPISISIV
jgi:hypothetical protein